MCLIPVLTDVLALNENHRVGIDLARQLKGVS